MKKKRNASYECYSLKLNGIFGECQEISVNFIKQRKQIKKKKAHEKECRSSLSVWKLSGEGCFWVLGKKSPSKETFVERECNNIC